MTATQLVVGMAEIHVAKGPALFTCLGLGSCIGFIALDPRSGVAGMIHIMLPEEFKDRPNDKPGKFADTGIPALMRRIVEAGGTPSRLACAYSGGAQVFKFGAGQQGRLDVGARNAVAVEEMVRKLRLRCVGVEVGGSSGRTMTVNTETGIVKVRTVSGGERVLCTLK